MPSYPTPPPSGPPSANELLHRPGTRRITGHTHSPQINFRSDEMNRRRRKTQANGQVRPARHQEEFSDCGYRSSNQHTNDQARHHSASHSDTPSFHSLHRQDRKIRPSHVSSSKLSPSRTDANFPTFPRRPRVPTSETRSRRSTIPQVRPRFPSYSAHGNHISSPKPRKGLVRRFWKKFVAWLRKVLYSLEVRPLWGVGLLAGMGLLGAVGLWNAFRGDENCDADRIGSLGLSIGHGTKETEEAISHDAQGVTSPSLRKENRSEVKADHSVRVVRAEVREEKVDVVDGKKRDEKVGGSLENIEGAEEKKKDKGARDSRYSDPGATVWNREEQNQGGIKQNTGNKKEKKEKGKLNRLLTGPGSMGDWWFDEFVGFAGTKGSAFAGAMKMFQLLVNQWYRLTPSMVPRTLSILLDLYFLDTGAKKG